MKGPIFFKHLALISPLNCRMMTLLQAARMAAYYSCALFMAISAPINRDVEVLSEVSRQYLKALRKLQCQKGKVSNFHHTKRCYAYAVQVS